MNRSIKYLITEFGHYDETMRFLTAECSYQHKLEYQSVCKHGNFHN